MPAKSWTSGSDFFHRCVKVFSYDYAKANVKALNGLTIEVVKPRSKGKMDRGIRGLSFDVDGNVQFPRQKNDQRSRISSFNNQQAPAYSNRGQERDMRVMPPGHYHQNHKKARNASEGRTGPGGSDEGVRRHRTPRQDRMITTPILSRFDDVHGNAPQHPKGLRGKAAADYWRNYGRMKKAEKIASGTYKKPDRKNELGKLEIYPDDAVALQAALENLRKNPLPVSNQRKIEIKPKPTCITIDETDDGEVVTSWQEEAEEMEEIMEIADSKSEENMASVPALPAAKATELNNSLLRDWKKKISSGVYQNMLAFRWQLPAYSAKENLLKIIRENQVCVVSGETGCGKTTQLPQFILDDYISRGEGASCKIICTQPRRISAISVSERIAKERAESLGQSVGYQIRLEKRLPREHGSILMCTTGILLQWLSTNRNLEGISHIIVDEIHEQDVLSDFLLIILKDLLPVRPTLKVIMMSATINAQKFSDYFGGCPLVEIPGRIFPVKEHFLEDVLAVTSYYPQRDNVCYQKRDNEEYRRKDDTDDFEKQQFLQHVRMNYPRKVYDLLNNHSDRLIDYDLINVLVRHIHRKYPLDEAVLIFLPGWEDIRKMNSLLEKFFSPNSVLIIPLHSMIPTIDQRYVFERPVGRRKVVIATSIAETSITIDDVVHVIDTGKIKAKQFDVEKNISMLTPQWVSVSNAKQRKGRAGRVKSGICYRLYTSHQYDKFAPYPLPEIQRTPLEELCLQLKLLRLGKVEPFLQKAMEPPSQQAIQNALDLLTFIDALDGREELTSLGNLLARMPVPPQLGKMMYLACIFQCVNPVLNICAALSYRDPFGVPLGQEKEGQAAKNSFGANCSGDHLLVHNAIEAYSEAANDGQDLRDFCWENFLFPSTCKQILKMKGQFARILLDSGFLRSSDPRGVEANTNSANYDLVRSVIAGGLYPNLGRLRPVKNPRQTPRVVISEQELADAHPKTSFSSGGVARGVHGPAVFFQKMKTSSVFVFDLTVVPCLAAFLFAKNVALDESEIPASKSKKQGNHNEMTVIVDGRLELCMANLVTFDMLSGFKTAFHQILLRLFESPSRTDALNAEAKEVLRIAVEMLGSVHFL